ncbi:hypothetical protein [Desulfotomaculum nigrificans]|uniref:hypothetical protein n=1 Tax=Desulfotomaculum nigrificans TaxID=1565 RepID=UPI0001FAE688|nr:hypothetical protein [Desulfotomaculum nigrificans]
MRKSNLIKFQLTGIVILMLTFSIFATGYISYRQIKQTANISALEKAKSDLVLSEAYMANLRKAKGPGDNEFYGSRLQQNPWA